MRVALFVGLLLVPVLAGCVTTPAEKPPVTVTDPPLFSFDAAEAVDWWEEFATEYQKRDAYLPANKDARAHLVSELERIGMDVEVRTYPAASRGLTLPGQVPADMVAIVGIKPGLGAPDHRIGLVSHFDTQAATIQGAYDDASGVAAEFAICEALAQVPLNKTLACIFFDAEEQGLEASKAYVEDVTAGDEDFVYDWVLGYDMTGINWPGHDWKMYVMTGGPDHVEALVPLAEHVMHEELGYPTSGVEVLPTHDRNSDERRFRDAGIPIYRFAGGRHAADYPEYHRPGDTVDYVYSFVGGRPDFEAGFTTIVEGSWHLALALDATDLEGS